MSTRTARINYYRPSADFRLTFAGERVTIQAHAGAAARNSVAPVSIWAGVATTIPAHPLVEGDVNFPTIQLFTRLVHGLDSRTNRGGSCSKLGCSKDAWRRAQLFSQESLAKRIPSIRPAAQPLACQCFARSGARRDSATQSHVALLRPTGLGFVSAACLGSESASGAPTSQRTATVLAHYRDGSVGDSGVVAGSRFDSYPLPSIPAMGQVGFPHSNSRRCPDPDNLRLQDAWRRKSSLVRSCAEPIRLARTASKQATSLRDGDQASANCSRVQTCRKQWVFPCR